MHRKLLLGTAVLGLMIGVSAPAGAQQYFSRFRESDKPPVEVDMDVLNASPKQQTRVADYSYVRSPDMQKDEPAAAPAPEKPKAKTVEDQAEAVALQAQPAPKKKTAKTAKKHSKKHATEIVADTPPPAPKPAGPIISQPPARETAAPALEHRDIGAMAPIISNPPDSGAPAVVQQRQVVQPNMMGAPVVASRPSMLPPDDVLADEQAELAREAVPRAPAPAKPVVAPSPVSPKKSKKHHVMPEMSRPPEADSAPAETYAAPAAPHVTTSAARDMTEDRPVATPLPDIKIVHDADNPEVAEPLPVPQPEVHRTPRDEPLPLPKGGKIGHTTAPLLMQRPGLGSAPPADVLIPPASPTSGTEAAIVPPIAAPAATAAPPEDVTAAMAMPPDETAPATPSMPVVPTMSDLTLTFTGNSSDLSPETQKKLDGVIHQMSEMTDGRLQVRGYAAGEDGSKSSARRIALSRALSVRSYLMDKGIKPTRVDVRALGTETDRSPIDRVDLLFVR